jgi:hypothetical protein
MIGVWCDRDLVWSSRHCELGELADRSENFLVRSSLWRSKRNSANRLDSNAKACSRVFHAAVNSRRCHHEKLEA